MSDFHFTFEPSSDYELLQAIATHPKLWERQTNDFSPHREEFQIPCDPSLLYVLIKDQGELLGFWCFVKQSPVLWEFHICMLPKSWGKRSVAAASEMLNWLWKNTSCQRLVGQVPEYNRPVVNFLQRFGMSQWGVNEKCWLKDSKLWNMVWMGVSRP